MVIFWNLAGVPFVRSLTSPSDYSILTVHSVVRLLRRLHGLARSVEVPLLDADVRSIVRHAHHRVLHVSTLRLADQGKFLTDD